MKKKAPIELSEGPSPLRRQHTPFTRDVLTPRGAPVIARHRARLILTPYPMRCGILEEAAEKPESVRIRSLRRRLTNLDRALSDGEAQALDWIATTITGLSNVGCVDLLRSEVKRSPFGRFPFGEAKGRNIACMSFVLKRLSSAHRSAVLELASLLDPNQSLQALKPGLEFIEAIRAAAAFVVSLREDWHRQNRRGETMPHAAI